MKNLGNRDFFRNLVDEYKDKVVNTCYGFLHNFEDAEDTAQEVFIEIYLSYEKFKGKSTISTWIYRIAVNKSFDFLRKQNSKKRINLFKNILNIDTIEQKDIKSVEEYPLINIEQKERETVLFQALDKIPVNQRIAITLSKLENLSIREIAKIMDTTESAVESLIFRAKTSLKKLLEKYYC